MKPARLEPTNRSRLDERIKDHIRQITPRLGVVEAVHPYTEEGTPSNYKVDVRLIERATTPSPADDSEGGPTGGEGGASTSQTPTLHEYVPVGVASHGASKGLREDELVLVQYRGGNPRLPVVTHSLYEDAGAAPFTKPGDFRRKIGNGVIEIVSDGEGERRINIGRQTDDRAGLDAGLSINIDDGSFSISNEEGHGLFVDEAGNSIFKWESFASPWGAAGPVNWTDAAGGGVNDRTITITVLDSADEPVPEASILVELVTETVETDGGAIDLGPGEGEEQPTDDFTALNLTTDAEGSVEASVPDNTYMLAVTYPDDVEDGAVVTGEFEVSGYDLEIIVDPDGIRSVGRPSDEINEQGPVRREVTEYESSVETALFEEVNAARADSTDPADLPELLGDEDLSAIARWHSAYLGTGPRELLHNDETYGGHADRLEEANFSTTASAENLARYRGGSETEPATIATEIVEAWRTSEGHSANLFSGDYDTQGIGVYLDEDAEPGGIYITHLFAATESDSADEEEEETDTGAQL